MSPEQKKSYHIASAKQWRLDHLERSKETAKEWALFNKEKFAAIKKAWRIANPEKVAAQKKRHRQKNADRIREKNRKYQNENRDKTRAWSRKHFKKSYSENPEKWINYASKRRGAKGDGKLTRNLAKRLFVEQGGLCKICGCDMLVSGFHRDHIIALSKGGAHEDSNIQLLCPPCNRSKFNK